MKTMHTKINSFLTSLALTLVAAAPASADVTKIRITGVFEATQTDNESGLNIFAPLEGRAFTMIFDYDPSVPDSDNIGNEGTYLHPVPAHELTLTSGSITLSELVNYRLKAYVGPNGSGNSYYSIASFSNAANASGLTLPGNTDSFRFGIIHPVPDTVLDFLDIELASDPLPDVPFFLGNPTTGAYVYVNLTTYDSELNEYYDDTINATITSIEIAPDPSEADPVLHWELEEGSGTTTTEAVSGETAVAQFINGPTWTTGLAPGSSHAVHFENTTPDSYIDAGTLQADNQYVPTTSAVDNRVLSSGWTVAGWIQVPEGSAGSDNCILTSDTDGPGWWLFFTHSWNGRRNSLGFDFSNVRSESDIDLPTGRPVFVSISGNPVTDSFGTGMRHRFAVWDGTTWKYKTGSQYISIRLDGLEIGSFNNGTREFKGSIDELRIYDKALGDDELTALALNNALGGGLGAVATAPQSLTSGNEVAFTVQFTEDVTGFDTADLVVTSGPSLSTGTPVISGSGSTYTVTIGVTGDGPISLDLIPGTGVQTLSGQPLVNHIPSAVLEVDQTAPAATAFTLVGSNPTGALSVSFQVTFSEPVTGFNNAADLNVSHSGTTSTGASISGGGANYTVTLTGVTGAGTFSVAVDPAGGTIDAAGNPVLVGVSSETVTHVIDTTPPTVVSITPDTTGPVSSNSIVGFTVVFSEPVLGFLNSSAITKTTTNLAESYFYNVATSDQTTFTLDSDARVLDGQASGTLAGTVSLAAGITDLAGNPLAGPSPTSDAVVLTATDYQLWAIAKGLAPGANFSYFDDADLDGRINGEEFARDGNPLVAGDPIKQRMHLEEIEGQKYGVLTIAAPDDFVYSETQPGKLRANYQDYWATLDVEDLILSSIDLVNWPSASAPLVEDPSIAMPLGMPPLSSGWSYRHFRITEPVTTLPKAFMKAETIDND